jgi:uncharacterized repeat protein (TIGR02543 family)
MVGYATVDGEGYTTTTGGQGGAVITISTLAQLQAWALTRENKTVPEIVHISGKIEASASTVVTIKHGANVSVLGVGSTAELKNVGLNFRNYKNVIVRNLKIHEVFYPNDGLTIDECQHVWIDHNEFHSIIGPGIGVDTYDGLMDIKNGSRYVTVSWNHFHDHMKTVLVGHTDNSGAEATDRQIRVTFHHNYFENTDGRNPSLRWGAVHMYNNYLRNISDYGIAVRQGAHALLENNVYENVKLPVSTNKFDGEGFACERGNLFTGTSGANSITQTDCAWWTSTTLPYEYTLDPVTSVTSTVPGNVGVGKVDVTGGGTPPVVTYALTTAVTGQGTVLPAAGPFTAGTIATLTATPSEGWQFSSWSGDASGTTNPVAVTMNANKAVTAIFSRIEYQIATTVIGQGTVTSSAGPYYAGEIATFTATPAPGWKFDSWGGDAMGTNNPVAVALDGNKAVTANFTRLEYQVAATVAGEGSIEVSNGPYYVGATATLTATPAAGWKFDHWSGSATGTTNPLTFTVEGNTSVTAHFSRLEYRLTVLTEGQGSVSYTDRIYYAGETAVVTAVAASGYEFSGWGGAASGTTNPLTISMKANTSITAKFTKKGNPGGGNSAGVVNVYPNPMRGATTFEVSLVKKAKVKISILYSDGRLLQVVTNQSYNAGANQIPYVNGNMVAGLYFYVVEIDKEVIRGQLMVE